MYSVQSNLFKHSLALEKVQIRAVESKGMLTFAPITLESSFVNIAYLLLTVLGSFNITSVSFFWNQRYKLFL